MNMGTAQCISGEQATFHWYGHFQKHVKNIALACFLNRVRYFNTALARFCKSGTIMSPLCIILVANKKAGSFFQNTVQMQFAYHL